MTGKLEGEVAFITGAARGQGRAHAIAMAREGADIIGIDICRDIPSNPYPLATPEDLADMERSVKETGRRVVTRVADVRERHELRAAVEAGLAELGRLDIVVANAGILPMAMGKPDPMQFVDASDVDLLGVMNTVAVSIPHLSTGSSIVVTGSTAGMIRGTTTSPDMGPGWMLSKHSHGIRRTNEFGACAADDSSQRQSPTNCNTHLLQNDGMYSLFRPDLTAEERRRLAKTPSRFSHCSKRCRYRMSSQRTWPTSESSWPVRTVATSPGNRSASMVAHFSSGPTALAVRSTRCPDSPRALQFLDWFDSPTMASAPVGPVMPSVTEELTSQARMSYCSCCTSSGPPSSPWLLVCMVDGREKVRGCGRDVLLRD